MEESHPIRPPHKLSVTCHPVPQLAIKSKLTEDFTNLDDSLESDNTHDPASNMQRSEFISKQMQEETIANLESKCPLSQAVSGSCNHNGGLLISEHGDLTLTIPKGAIKEGDVVTFSVASGLYGPFVLPSKCQTDLASPYYWIGVSGSYHFHKPIQVEFEHFAVVTACDPSHYQLLCCEDDESYTMQRVDYELGFTMQGNISLCTFETCKFCSYCLYHGCKYPMINRIAAIYLKNKDFQYSNDFTTEIWFSLPTSKCIKRNTELYSEQGMILDNKSSHYFEASCDKSSTDYFVLSYDEEVSDWYLSHSRSTEIETKSINFYNYYTDTEELRANEFISLFPPRFIINVTKKPNCNTELRTSIMVTLHKAGEKSPKPIPFYLFVPKSTETTTIQRMPLTSVGEHQCDKNKPELNELVKYSSKIADHWKEIALNLKICEHKIATIDIDCNKVKSKCYEMFNTWLQSDSSPCWCHFIQALHTVELHNLAEETATKYLKYCSERISI